MLRVEWHRRIASSLAAIENSRRERPGRSQNLSLLFGGLRFTHLPHGSANLLVQTDFLVMEVLA